MLLEFWLLSCRMPETKNFNNTLRFANTVVDLQRRVEKLPNSGITLHRRTDVRKLFEKIDMAEKGIGKLFAGSRVFLP